MNPACRAARHFPRLPGARLLLSLNDFDLLAREDYGLPEEDSYGRAMIVRPLWSLVCVSCVCLGSSPYYDPFYHPFYHPF